MIPYMKARFDFFESNWVVKLNIWPPNDPLEQTINMNVNRLTGSMDLYRIRVVVYLFYRSAYIYKYLAFVRAFVSHFFRI